MRILHTVLGALSTPWLASVCCGKKVKDMKYYDILDIQPGATEDEIKKAYRRKSREFHPDKCEKERADECQSKFIELSQANEVLTDPDKRKKYDKGGVDALEKDGHEFNAEEMFKQHFGREPIGKVHVRVLQFPNGQQQYQFFEEPEAGPEENMFSDDGPVYEISSQGHATVLDDRDEPWCVFFYSPKCTSKECRAAVKEYKEAAAVFQTFVKVAAVNCFKNQQLCRHFEQSLTSKTAPVLLWFSEKKRDAEKFENEMVKKEMSIWIAKNIPNSSTELLTKADLRKFVERAHSKSRPAVVLFTDKRDAPPMWKALSREFKNRVELGLVPRCDKQGLFKNEIQQHFGVDLQKIPSVALLDNKLGLKEVYAGRDFKKEKLSLWMQKNIAVFRKSGPQGQFKQWDGVECQAKDSNFCLILLRVGGGIGLLSETAREVMQALADKYRTDPVRFRWACAAENPNLLAAFGLPHGAAPGFHAVMYRPKRGTFKRLALDATREDEKAGEVGGETTTTRTTPTVGGTDKASLWAGLKSFVDATVFEGASLPEKFQGSVTQVRAARIEL